MKTRITTIMLALAFLLGVGAAVGAPAETVYAAGECNTKGHVGYSLVRSYDMLEGDSGLKTGALEVYWSNTEGRNCAIARAYGPSYGEARGRKACIRLGTSTTWNCDSGVYSYYAGPVYSANSRGKCIDVLGRFWYHDHHENLTFAFRELNNVHCS